MKSVLAQRYSRIMKGLTLRRYITVPALCLVLTLLLSVFGRRGRLGTPSAEEHVTDPMPDDGTCHRATHRGRSLGEHSRWTCARLALCRSMLGRVGCRARGSGLLGWGVGWRGWPGGGTGRGAATTLEAGLAIDQVDR